eukprot:2678953-Amphidinium_carterae.2
MDNLTLQARHWEAVEKSSSRKAIQCLAHWIALAPYLLLALHVSKPFCFSNRSTTLRLEKSAGFAPSVRVCAYVRDVVLASTRWAHCCQETQIDQLPELPAFAVIPATRGWLLPSSHWLYAMLLLKNLSE